MRFGGFRGLGFSTKSPRSPKPKTLLALSKNGVELGYWGSTSDGFSPCHSWHRLFSKGSVEYRFAAQVLGMSRDVWGCFGMFGGSGVRGFGGWEVSELRVWGYEEPCRATRPSCMSRVARAATRNKLNTNVAPKAGTLEILNCKLQAWAGVLGATPPKPLKTLTTSLFETGRRLTILLYAPRSLKL